MKKVLSLVLAVMMMSTLAFAAVHPGPFPGDEIKIPAADFTQVADPATGATPTNLNADDYTVSKIDWTKNRNLVESVKVKKGEVVVTLKENYTLDKDTTLEGTITIREKTGANRKSFITGTLSYVVNNSTEKVTLAEPKDEYSLNVDANTLYTIDAPKGYSGIYFGDSDFEVAGRVYDKEKLFLEYDFEYDKDVLLANEDVDTDITFLNFVAKPSFKGLQTVSLYVEEGTKVYENKDGKLTEIKGKYDKETNAFEFTTRTLGSYVWADKALKSVAATTAPSEGNPDTGANDVVGIATALAAVALVSAAAISLKK